MKPNIKQKWHSLSSLTSSSDPISDTQSSSFQAGWSALDGMEARASDGKGPFDMKLYDEIYQQENAN